MAEFAKDLEGYARTVTPSFAPDSEPGRLSSAAAVDGVPLAGGYQKPSLFAPRSPEAIAERGLQGTASPLPHKDLLERSFGIDLGGVEAFVDDAARQATSLLGANAYASGTAIAFATPTPSPALVAHELTHVLQQSTGRIDTSGTGIEKSGEREAERVEATVAAGGTARSALSVDPRSIGSQRRGRPALSPAQEAPAAQDAAPSAPRTPANVGPNVLRQADALVAAFASAALEERAAAYREALTRRATSPMFQAALVRAMDAEARATIAAAPEGLAWDQLVQFSRDLTAGQAAGAGAFDGGRFWNQSPIWQEAFIGAFVGSKGAREAARQLVNAGPIINPALGRAQRNGLITAADAQIILAANPQLEGSVTALAQPLGDARERYEEARAALDALEQELVQHLYDVGATMTDDEIMTYVEEFRADERYIAARRAAQQAADALGIELETVGDDLLARGTATSEAGEDSRTALLDSYEALAGDSDRAFEAVRWAEQHVADPMFSAEERELIREISERGQATDAEAKLAEVTRILEAAQTAPTPEDKRHAVQRAVAYLKQTICDPYGQIRSIIGITELAGYLDQVGREAQTLVALIDGGQDAAVAVATTLLREMPPASSTIVSRTWSTVGTIVSTIKNTNGVVNPRNSLAFITAARGLQQNYERLRDITGAVKAADRAAEVEAARLVGRIAGGYGDLTSLGFGAIAIGADLIALQQTLNRINEHPDNVAMQIQCAAEFAALLGSVLALLPPPVGTVGLAISACASAIGAIAGVFVGDPEGDRVRANESALVGDVLDDPALAALVEHPATASNLRAAQAGGLAPETIRALARERRWLFNETAGYISRIDSLRRWLETHPEAGRFTGGTPSLQALISTLDQTTLDGLAYVGAFAEGGTLEGPEMYFLLGQVEDLLPAYHREF